MKWEQRALGCAGGGGEGEGYCWGTGWCPRGFGHEGCQCFIALTFAHKGKYSPLGQSNDWIEGCIVRDVFAVGIIYRTLI